MPRRERAEAIPSDTHTVLERERNSVRKREGETEKGGQSE